MLEKLLQWVVSYQSERFSSKWELPFLHPSSLELWRKERARKAALILMKNSQFDRTLRYGSMLEPNLWIYLAKWEQFYSAYYQKVHQNFSLFFRHIITSKLQIRVYLLSCNVLEIHSVWMMCYCCLLWKMVWQADSCGLSRHDDEGSPVLKVANHKCMKK